MRVRPGPGVPVAAGASGPLGPWGPEPPLAPPGAGTPLGPGRCCFCVGPVIHATGSRHVQTRLPAAAAAALTTTHSVPALVLACRMCKAYGGGQQEEAFQRTERGVTWQDRRAMPSDIKKGTKAMN